MGSHHGRLMCLAMVQRCSDLASSLHAFEDPELLSRRRVFNLQPETVNP